MGCSKSRCLDYTSTTLRLDLIHFLPISTTLRVYQFFDYIHSTLRSYLHLLYCLDTHHTQLHFLRCLTASCINRLAVIHPFIVHQAWCYRCLTEFDRVPAGSMGNKTFRLALNIYIKPTMLFCWYIKTVMKSVE
jgi:hypothetical protein